MSTVYEPGSVFKMLTATAALGDGTVTPKTKIRDTGTLRLDGGTPKSTTPTTRAMGVMTFEDAIAYSRNVVAAKVALQLGKTTGQAASEAVRDVAQAGLRRADRHRRRQRGRGHRARPGRRRRGARSTSPTARSARASR